MAAVEDLQRDRLQQHQRQQDDQQAAPEQRARQQRGRDDDPAGWYRPAVQHALSSACMLAPGSARSRGRAPSGGSAARAGRPRSCGAAASPARRSRARRPRPCRAAATISSRHSTSFGSARERGQQRRLAAGQPHHAVRPAQLAALAGRNQRGRAAPGRAAAPAGGGGARGAGWCGCAAPARAGRTACRDSRRRPASKPGDAVVRRAARGQHQDRHVAARSRRSASVSVRPLSPGIMTSSTIRSDA